MGKSAGMASTAQPVGPAALPASIGDHQSRGARVDRAAAVGREALGIGAADVAPDVAPLAIEDRAASAWHCTGPIWERPCEPAGSLDPTAQPLVGPRNGPVDARHRSSNGRTTRRVSVRAPRIRSASRSIAVVAISRTGWAMVVRAGSR